MAIITAPECRFCSTALEYYLIFINYFIIYIYNNSLFLLVMPIFGQLLTQISDICIYVHRGLKQMMPYSPSLFAHMQWYSHYTIQNTNSNFT